MKKYQNHWSIKEITWEEFQLVSIDVSHDD